MNWRDRVGIRDFRFVAGVVVGGLLVGMLVPFVTDHDAPTTSAVTTTGNDAEAQPSAGGNDGIAAGESPTDTVPTGSDPAAGSQTGVPTAVAGATEGTRTASDQGVTAESIKVGIMLLNLDELSSTGLGASNGTVSQRKAAWQAIIDAKNKAGGIDGRRIFPVFEEFPATDPQAQVPSCRRVAEQKPFFAFGDAGVIDLAALCMTRDHGIPMMSFQSVDASVMTAAKGLLFTSLMTNDRILYNHVLSLHEAGELKGKRIGLVDQEGFKTFDTVEIPTLKKYGYQIQHRSTLSQDIGTAQSQIPVEVSQMRLNNVDYILWEGGVLYLNIWANEADKQGYHPRYSMSDFNAGTDDFGLQAVTGELNAIGWGSRRKLEHNSNAPESAPDRNCREIASAAGKPMNRQEDYYWEVTRYCGQLEAFAAAVHAAGLNPTRVAAASRLQQIGRMPYFDVGPGDRGGSFAPGKHDAADFLHPLRADTQCRCWRLEGSWIPAKPVGG